MLLSLRNIKNIEEIQRRLKNEIKITWKSLKIWIRRKKVVQSICKTTEERIRNKLL